LNLPNLPDGYEELAHYFFAICDESSVALRLAQRAKDLGSKTADQLLERIETELNGSCRRTGFAES
jgi:hypothetical protein